MIEPRRLLDHGASESERALLRSARLDVPPRGAPDRMFAALTAGPSEHLPQGSSHGAARPWSGQGSSLAAPSVKLGVLAKLGLAALVGVGALGTGALIRLALERPAAALRPPSSLASARPATRAPVTDPPVAHPAQEPTVVGRQVAGDVSNTRTLERPSAPALRRRQSTPTGESLGGEIRLLDAARAAVDAHDPAAAERALESYAKRFPRGRLKPEATVLRLAVLVGRGNGMAARKLAERLLASDAYRAYQPRIRSLLRANED